MENINTCLTFLTNLGVSVEGLSAKGEYTTISCLLFRVVMYATIFPLKNNVWFILTPIYFVLSSCFINVIFIDLYTGVQHHFHIRCLCWTVIWRVPLVEQELLTLPEDPSSLLVFSGVHVAWSLVFCVAFCLSFFFWPLYCLSFFDLWLLITPLVS